MPTNPFGRILGWLRAGYPDGIPQRDYVALFGLLHRQLTEAEIDQVAHALHERGDTDEPDPAHVAAAIRQAVHETPTDEDVRRVSARLALGGWPLADASDPAANDAVGEPES